MPPSAPKDPYAEAITLSIWFVNLYNFKHPQDTSLHSKLEILIFLDSGDYICVSNLPTCTILADHLLNCSKCTPAYKDFYFLSCQ